MHGFRDSPDNLWISWLRGELEARGFEVITPLLPNSNMPRLDKWLTTLGEAVGELDAQTTLVAYSLGTPTTLRLLDNYPQDIKLAGLVLVAGFGDGIRERPGALFSPPLNFERLVARANMRVVIYSDNDPIVAPKRSKLLATRLAAREVIVLGAGHFLGGKRLPGSTATLPAALEAVLSAYPSSFWKRLRNWLSWARPRLSSKI